MCVITLDKCKYWKPPAEKKSKQGKGIKLWLWAFKSIQRSIKQISKNEIWLINILGLERCFGKIEISTLYNSWNSNGRAGIC